LGAVCLIDEVIEDKKPDRDVEEGQAHDDEAHDCATAEGEPKAGVERFARGIGHPCGRIRCCLHSEEACEAREKTACEEGERHPLVLQVQTVSQPCKDGCEYDEE